MNILVTGGAGFIGRWVVKRLTEDNHNIWILDNLANSSIDNIKDLQFNYPNITFIEGSIMDTNLLETLFINKFDICYHLAASINVQDSIDDPKTTFENDVIGTFNVLQQCKINNTKFVYMSTCMVYSKALNIEGISESHPTCPASPYAAAKLAGENLALSYYYAYGLPTTVLRPFNTYGPYQKQNSEGGVISIFIDKKLMNKPLAIYGDGKQTRDFLYVTDCADFVVEAGYSEKTNGKIVNAGSGVDISITELAKTIAGETGTIKYVTHIHPQSEIQKLLCDSRYSKKILGWSPKVSLVEGISKTEEFLRTQL
ncbi:GDP-mannose 4,6-dehydratase [Clostridium cellulovorans]|uniref:NAD-dependent epimerase/dehydratase n=1 Tax=Clostridium cellulovorans (strain ATCC 35296 / DSM 3052 / OCM 3 / 743B) TaxID=573061 RepID=D9SLY0_CLOC7|nr:GDP-mannose 4,6-dehydratase [Clostridium cellulovorans]ADL51711.1 NAD-dependent epimerase/dehydratase [Clostridium cellulovorans 743B]